MTSTFMGLELGKRALFAQQAALNTTGHNIANANTDGYTRQRAEMQATNAIPYPGMNNAAGAGQLGTGVEVNSISRLREGYLDTQYRNQNKDLGYYTSTSDTYSRIETLLNEPSDTGISNAMDQFWQGWEELSKTPDSAAARAVVVQRGQALAETFQYTKDNLDQISSDDKNALQVDVQNVQSLSDQIGALNDQISRLVPNNYQPNDLYDKRDALLDQLSKLVSVDVQPSTNGMVDVSVKLDNQGATQPLIQGTSVKKVAYNEDSSGTPEISIDNNVVTLQSGQIQGRIDSIANTKDIKKNIDDLESAFAQQVNALHNAQKNTNATDLNGNPGGDFFSIDQTNTDTSQTKWVVNPDFSTNLNLIAAANSPNAGDGSNALAIANIQTTTLKIGNTTATAADFYQNIIGRLGVDSQQAQRMQDNTQTMVNQVDNQRQSVSGVSMDEEMTNMIRFQQAYNAAARVVTTMDQVLDKVINGMGATT